MSRAARRALPAAAVLACAAILVVPPSSPQHAPHHVPPRPAAAAAAAAPTTPAPAGRPQQVPAPVRYAPAEHPADPFAPSAGHGYRHGAQPTLARSQAMRAWAAAHPAGAHPAGAHPAGAHPAGPAAATTTTTTAATGPQTLSYAGGASGIGVTSGAPKVYLVFWGSQWGTQGVDATGNLTFSTDPASGAPYLQRMFRGLGTGTETWSGVLTQYCDGAGLATGATSCSSGLQTVGYPNGGPLAGVWYDNASAEPSAATGSQLATEANAAAVHFGNTTQSANRYAQYVILSATGLNPDGYRTGGFCAWHSAAYSSLGWVAYTNMPYVMDMGGSCGQGFVNSDGSLDGYSIVEGHEYAETITDQVPGYGWVNRTGSAYNGEENGDECAWIRSGQGASANVNTATGAFAMQSTWSNDTNRCDIAHPVVAGSGNQVSVSVPSSLNGNVGSPVSVQVSATDSIAGSTLTFSATGLPAGVSINAATGLISGSPTTAKTYTASVTATDQLGVSGSAPITWVIGAAIPLGGRIAGVTETPGLPVAVALSPTVPAGRDLRAVTWQPGRSDCAVTDGTGGTPAPAALQVAITCNAAATGTATLSATLTDSTGAKATVSGTITFAAAGVPRAVMLSTTVDGQDLAAPATGGPAPTVCSGITATTRVTAVDVATGQPVKGYTVAIGKQPLSSTTLTVLAHPLTDVAGHALYPAALSGATTYSVTGAAQGPFAAAAAPAGTVTPITCTASLDTTTLSAANPWWGDTVVVTGALLRDTTTGTAGIAGQTVQVTVTTPASGSTAARTTTLATATTSTDSSSPAFSMKFSASASGDLRLLYKPLSGATPVTVDLGTLTVNIPTTALAASTTASNVGYGTPVTVAGSLTKTTTMTSPITGASVLVTVQPATGPAVRIGSATVTSAGQFTLTASVYTTGTLIASYAGARGLPAASAVAGPIVVGTWTTSITLAPSASSVTAGTVVTYTGTVSGSYHGFAKAPVGSVVTLYLTPSSGAAPVVLTRATVGSNGAYLAKAVPSTSGTVVAKVSPAGYTSVTSTGCGIAVH